MTMQHGNAKLPSRPATAPSDGLCPCRAGRQISCSSVKNSVQTCGIFVAGHRTWASCVLISGGTRKVGGVVSAALKYRPEIDGLRTIAVIPVILYHAGLSLFQGGFVGVDVFFVISGYLITTILIRELDRGEFSIVRFYERRARRILPALLAVIACTIPVAWIQLDPARFIDFSESVIATMLFASNFLFWSEAGYFDLDAENKPLLHTWSLA